MKKLASIFLTISIAGCATATLTSMKVIEYDSTTEMAEHAKCEAIDSVYSSYDVFMHPPWERKRAAHIQLKDAAYEKGANAVIMTSNSFGVITDQVQGVAYKCTYGKN